MRRCLLLALALLGCQSPAPPVATPTAATRTLLAMGDSLTAGLGVEPEESYPAQLEKRLRKDGLAWNVVNGGISGETSSGALSRLNWALKSRPDAVILETGANDSLRGIDPAITEKNLEAILSRFEKEKIPVFLMGMRALENYGPDYGKRFAAVYARVVAKHKTPRIDFFLEGVAMQKRYNQEDRVHPTAPGYAVIVNRTAPPLETWLKRL